MKPEPTGMNYWDVSADYWGDDSDHGWNLFVAHVASEAKKMHLSRTPMQMTIRNLGEKFMCFTVEERLKGS